MLFERAVSSDETYDPRYAAMVFDLPMIFTGRTGLRKRRLIPTMVIRTPEGEIIPQEVVAWATEMAEIWGLDVLRRNVGVIANLHNFWLATGSRVLETPQDVDLLIDSFLLNRVMTPEAPSERLFPLWDAVTLNTVKSDLRAIDSFVNSCRRNQGDFHPMSQALRASNGVFAERAVPRQRLSSFWNHLDNQFERYRELEPRSIEFPKAYKRLARFTSTTAIAEPTMSREVGDGIIECTKDYNYRSLFKAMAGTGGRKSEYLHMFRCDVQPAALSKRLIEYQSRDPVLLFAHPERTLWNGMLDPGTAKITRSEFLRVKYGGRLSRLDEATDKNEKAGWKGMRFDHHLLYRAPVWIRSDYAADVEAYKLEMDDWCRKHGIDKEHPYLFISTANRSTRGNFLRVEHVDRAFRRAAEAAGVWGMPGVMPHGFRHGYTAFLRNDLNLPPHIISLGLGHFHIDSQEHYGHSIKDVYNAVRAGGRSNAH